MAFFANLSKQLRANIREYGMFIALFVIMTYFTLMTNGTFISSRNIVNLINQTGYIAVLAVGMTLVIVIRQIDLSVGFLAGFMGAVAAILLKGFEWAWQLDFTVPFTSLHVVFPAGEPLHIVVPSLPVFGVIPAVLGLGILAGCITAFLVARMKIPSFVATLAGWLIYRGAILVVTEKTGTIIISDKIFNAIGGGYIPDLPIPLWPDIHKLTLILGVIGIVLYIISEFNNRRQKQAYNFDVLPMDMFILKLAFVSLLVGAVTWELAGYKGLSWTAVVVLVLVAIYNFVATQTVLGRHIYAVGGNPEAAELSGISVRRVMFLVFGSMGMLAALSGIMFASNLKSATTTAGNLFELDAIAAAYVGGVSAAGGVGSVVGSIVGALVMLSLTSGMNLMGIGISYQYMARGAVLAAAVIFDVATRSSAK